MSHKPQNEFEAEKERQEKARRKFYAVKREKQLKRRTGLSRQNQQLVIKGMAMSFTASPEIVQERRIHVERRDYTKGAPKGRSYHFAILRYHLRSRDGRKWTALQAQCHDANRGYILSVTGFWNLQQVT